MELEKFTVVRSKWVNGSNRSSSAGAVDRAYNPSALLNVNGNQCCVGFFAEQICLLSKSHIDGVSFLPPEARNEKNLNITALDRIYEINDHLFYSNEEREKLLKEEFAKLGYEIIFVD